MATYYDVLQMYLTSCDKQKNLDSKTIKAYRIDLTQFFSKYPIDIELVTRGNLAQYLESLHDRFRPKTVKRKMASLKVFFNYCKEMEFSLQNPVADMKLRYKEPFILPRSISFDQMNMLLQAVYTELANMKGDSYKAKFLIRDIAVIELLFATGLRVSELCALKTSDIDLDEYCIRIMGKGSKERVVQITNAEVIAALKRYALCFSSSNVITSFFQNRNGDPLSDQSVRWIIRRYAEKAHLKIHITPHMLRHTFATLLLEEDVDIRYIQNILGHSSITTTQIYTHVSANKLRSVLEFKHPRNKVQIR